MSISKLCGTARLLSYAAGVVMLLAQPASMAAPNPLTPALIQASVSIPNMSVVAPNFYRGGQPDYEGLRHLKEAGIKVDVSLDNEEKYTAAESQQAASLGLTYVHIPLSPFRRPSDADIARFLSIVSKKDDEPVFVHCVHGRDRTGAMVGIYRVVTEHVEPDAAYREMLDHGFRSFFKKLSDAVFDAPSRRESTVVTQ